MFYHGKASHVKPQAKASYIRPFNNPSENSIKMQDCTNDLKKSTEDDKLKPTPKGGLSCETVALISSIDESKEKHLKNLAVAHTNLFGEIEKIQSWKASVELECSSKGKRLEELNQIVDSQRKTLLDLQIKNEDLQSKLKEEIEKRVYVIEKFHFTKELSAVLEKKMNNIQVQFEKSAKIKGTFDIAYEQQLKVIENITMKFNCMRLECSEKLAALHQSLMDEKRNSLVLKDLCEKQSENMEKEHRSYCSLVEKFQEEVKQLSKELESKTNQNLCLSHEKDDLLTKMTVLEEKNRDTVRKLLAAEDQLKLLENSKNDLQKNFEHEVEKVNDLRHKCEEYSASLGKQKSEFVEDKNQLKESLNSLENCISEQKIKMAALESKKEELSDLLHKVENEKKLKEDLIDEIKMENLQLNEKIMHDTEVYDKSVKQLTDEMSELSKYLAETKEKLNTALSDNQQLIVKCEESEKEKFEAIRKLESAVLENEDLESERKKCQELSQQLQNLEQELKYNSELLSLKEKEIQNLKKSEEELLKFQVKNRSLEDCIQLKQELLIEKEKEIENLKKSEEELFQVQEKNRSLEDCIQLKEELLSEMELKVDEMSCIKEKCSYAYDKIAELEKNALEREEIIDEKHTVIDNLKADLKEAEDLYEKLHYENSTLREDLEKEKSKTNVCLDCKRLRAEVLELESLKAALAETQEELSKKSNESVLALKLLSEVEDNFDNMSVRKEKEIIKLKDVIEALEKELMITKVHADEAKNLKKENKMLLSKVEEFSIIKDNTFSKSDEKFDSLKPCKETLGKKARVVSHLQQAQESKKMEPDSSYDSKKKANKKPVPSVIAEKRKAMWDSESEGSECLQILFDSRDSKMKFCPQKKNFHSNKVVTETPISFSDKRTPERKLASPAMIGKSKGIENSNPCREQNDVGFSDFLSSCSPQIQCKNSPFIKRKMTFKVETPSTPKTPIILNQKKFFKTPLSERELPVKKPESNLWF